MASSNRFGARPVYSRLILSLTMNRLTCSICTYQWEAELIDLPPHSYCTKCLKKAICSPCLAGGFHFKNICEDCNRMEKKWNHLAQFMEEQTNVLVSQLNILYVPKEASPKESGNPPLTLFSTK